MVQGRTLLSDTFRVSDNFDFQPNKLSDTQKVLDNDHISLKDTNIIIISYKP